MTLIALSRRPPIMKQPWLRSVHHTCISLAVHTRQHTRHSAHATSSAPGWRVASTCALLDDLRAGQPVRCCTHPISLPFVRSLTAQIILRVYSQLASNRRGASQGASHELSRPVSRRFAHHPMDLRESFSLPRRPNRVLTCLRSPNNL